MTKFAVVICCCVIAAAVETMSQEPSKMYTTKYDNMDVDDILKNDRLFNSYYKCAMDTGKCTTEGEELKKKIPEAIDNKCEYCSEKQKEVVKKVVKFLVEKKNDIWKQLETKYDPQGVYKARYQEEAKQFNIFV